MECERLAQRMQALFDSFHEEDTDTSAVEQFQKECKEKFLHSMPRSEYCPDSHSTHEAQVCLPWREHELCRTKSAIGAEIWLNGTTLQEEQLNSNEGTPMTCLDAAGSQSPATDRKSNRIMSVLAESDYSMHHQEMYYTHHRHHPHHTHAGGHLGMHAAQTEPTRFGTGLSLDEDASHSSHCDAHHNFNYPHHHQHYRLHHHHHHSNNNNINTHRHGHEYTDYPQANLFQNARIQEESLSYNVFNGNHLEVPFSEAMNGTVENDADYDEPLTLEGLKEWHRKKMAVENSLHNTCSLQVRVMQWLNDTQNDPALLSAKDDPIAAEHVL